MRRLILEILAAAALLPGQAEEVKNRFGSRSAYLAAERILEKQNAPGVSLWRSDPFPVEPGKRYAGRMTLEILSRTPGAMASFRLVGLNREGRETGGTAEMNPSYQRLYGSGRSREAERILAAGPQTVSMRLELRLAGNPARIRIRSFSLVPYEEKPLYRGIYTPKEPYPDRDATLAALRKITPATSRVERRNGRPVLILDGRPVPVKGYKGSRDYGPLARAGANLMITFNSGTTLFWDKMRWDMATRQSDGSFDFTRLENELMFIYHQAPESRVLLTINCDVGEDFFRRHPESIFRNEKGELGVRQFGAFAGFGVPGPNPEKNRHWAVSYASREYQAYVCEGLKAVAEFLNSTPAGNIVAGFTLNGGHDDQYLQWEYSAARGQADYSPAAIAAYRRYLRKKYGTDAALRKAWNDPSVTLEKAPMFSEAEWKSRPIWNAERTGLDRKIADGREFLTFSIAEMQNRFGETLKRSFKRPCIVATYYSSPVWPQAGRSSLDELVRDGNIDMIFQVSDYSTQRRMGGPGASANFTIAAAALRNTLYVQEMDHRTWRTQITRGWDQKQAAEPADETEFRAQIRRDAGSVLAYGGDGFFLFDMFDSWYNDPRALSVLEEAFRAADWQARYRDDVPRTRTAVFLDERERLLFDQPGGRDCRVAWQLSGLTPDLYLLDDIRNPELPDYSLYIVPSPAALTAEQLAALKQKACRPGKVLILTGSVGILTTAKTGDSQPALEAFGLKTRTRFGGGEEIAEFLPGTGDPLLQNCSGSLGTGLCSIGGDNMLRAQRTRFPVSIADPDAGILGVWQNSRLPALAVRRSPQHGTLLYSAQIDGLTPQLLYNAALEAGITPAAAPGNSVAVGCGVASVYRLAGEVTLQFPETMEFFDPATGSRLGEGRRFHVPCEPWNGRIVLYRRKSSPTPSTQGDGK